MLLLLLREEPGVSFWHLNLLQRKCFGWVKSAPATHKTKEILSSSGRESTAPHSGIAMSAHGITHSFLFGTEIDTSSRSHAAFCVLSNKSPSRGQVGCRRGGAEGCGGCLCCEGCRHENCWRGRPGRQDGVRARQRTEAAGRLGTVLTAPSFRLFVHSFIHPFGRHVLSSYHVSGTRVAMNEPSPWSPAVRPPHSGRETRGTESHTRDQRCGGSGRADVPDSFSH